MAVVLLVLAVGSILVWLNPFAMCPIDQKDLAYKFGAPFKILTERGWIVGIDMNLTNRSKCDLSVKSTKLTVLSVSYSNGTLDKPGLVSEGHPNQDIPAGENQEISFIIEPPFENEPQSVDARIEIFFENSSTVLSVERTLQL